MIGDAFAPLSNADDLTLHALARESDCALVRPLPDPHALEPHGKAREIHHDEHVLEPAVLLADEISDGAAMVAVSEHCRRACMNPELVLDRRAQDVVARTERTVRVDQEFRHDEKRNALDAFGRIRRAREHEMDDVLGVVLLAVGDEDFLALKLVGAITLRNRPGAYRGQVRARLRLGQVHRAGPRASDHLGQEFFLEVPRTGELDRFDRSLRQHRAQVEGEIRRVPHLLDSGSEQMGQALAAELRRLGQTIPAVVAELLVGFLEAWRRLYAAVGKTLRAFAITDGIERRQYVGREFRAFLENGRHDVRRRLLEPR